MNLKPRRARRRLSAVLLAGLVIFCGAYVWRCGARIPGAMGIAISKAIHADPYISEFDRLFPDSEHFISYYTGVYGQPRWNSKTLLHGRYELSMSFDIDIERLGTKVTAIESPQFVVNPRRHVQRLDGGSKMISYEPEKGSRFGADEWRRLVAADGDLSVLGIAVITDSPVIETSESPPAVFRPAISVD